MSMPRLVKLQEEHKDKLVAIGPHCQNVPQEKVVDLCQQLKVNFTVTNNGHVEGRPFKGLPKVFLFDHTGQLIFDGRPDEGFDKLVKEALKNAPDWLLGGHTFNKLKTQAAAVSARKGLGKVLGECRKLSADPDPDIVTEAGWLVGALEPFGRSQLQEAKDAEADDPARALDLYARVSALFTGDPIGTDAADAVTRLKADPRAQNETAAATAVAKIEKASEGFRPCIADTPLDIVGCAGCKKKNAELLAALAAQCKAVAQKYPGTKAAARTEALLKRWGQ